MDAQAVAERRKYERMWRFAEYREDHATAHADAALAYWQARPGESVIDFGAGAGYASRRFRQAGLRVLAVDIAANAMDPAIAADVPLLLAPLWDIPVDLSSDYGFCSDVMEHIPTDRVDDVLRVIRRSVRGPVYFSIALRGDWCGRLIDDSLHLTVQPLDWWAARLSAHWPALAVAAHVAGHATDVVVHPGA